MKLSKDIKKRIDDYFDKISAEELYEIAVKKYSFEEENKMSFTDSFTIIPVSPYENKEFEQSLLSEETDRLLLAA